MSVSRLCSLLVLCSALGAAAWAEVADRSKPMHIEADSLRYDDVQQVSIFSGRVQVSKGSIQIRGERIEVRQDAAGYQHAVVTAGAGGAAFFRQKREGLEEYIEGEAEAIEYDGKLDTVRLVGKAQLRRLRGSTLADDISGGLIVYDNLRETFSVDATTAGKPTPGARVRAVLTPKADAPTEAASAPTPALRTTPSLRGARP